jgi:hypothetical protein
MKKNTVIFMLDISISKLILTAEHATISQLKNLNSGEKKILVAACNSFQNQQIMRDLQNNTQALTDLTNKLANRTIVVRKSCGDHGLLHIIRSLFKGIGNLLHLRTGTERLINKVEATIKQSLKKPGRYDAYATLIENCIDHFSRKANHTPADISKFEYTLGTIEEFYINGLNHNNLLWNNAANRLQQIYAAVVDKDGFFENAFDENDATLQQRLNRITGYNNPPPNPNDKSSLVHAVDSSSPVNVISAESIVMYECPITYEKFKDPVILLEDGFTYEREAIEDWLDEHPLSSPMAITMTTATILPNHAVLGDKVVCPITQQPFKRAYYCVEDGQTYEHDAILQYLKDDIRTQAAAPYFFKSPVTGCNYPSLTLHPNKILFSKEENLPATQDPERGVFTWV